MNVHPSLSLRLDDPTLNDSQRALLRCRLSKELEEMGDYEAARHALGDLWRRIGERPKLENLDRHSAAEVLLRAGALTGWLGSAKHFEGAQELAQDLISESIAIFESLTETDKIAEAQTDLAYCYWRKGAYDEARAILHDALSRLDDEDSEHKAVAMLRRAIVELSATRYSDALSILTEAAPLFQASDSHALKGKYHVNIGIILKNLSEGENREDYVDRALIEYAAASFHFEQAGHTFYYARTENNLGFLLFLNGRFSEAHEHLDRARQLFLRLKDSGSIAQVDDTRARTLLAEGHNAEAETLVRAAVRTLEKGDEKSVLAQALTTHGTSLARLNKHEEARRVLQSAIDVAESAGSLEDAGLAVLTIIEELSRQLPSDETQALYRRADQLLADSQHPRTLNRLREAARRVFDARPAGAHVREPIYSRFVYASEQTAKLLCEARRVAETSLPVLITGEDGTGKNLLAELIHEWSGRAGDFISIDCRKPVETHADSELFRLLGRQEFDAPKSSVQRAGDAPGASGSTLFLDGIASLGADHQARLLRLVEQGAGRYGATHEPETVGVRIIAADSGGLEVEAARGLFRADLWHWLRASHLRIPPLRERPEDIAALAEHFLREATERHGRRLKLSAEAVEALCALPLKGNARELRSIVERIVLTAPQGATMTKSAVEMLGVRRAADVDAEGNWNGCSLFEEVQGFENSLIEMALQSADGQVTRAARLLGISHQSLSQMLRTRHNNLLHVRKPVVARKRSITRQPQQDAAPAVKKATQHVSILHVEDNELVAEALRETLEAEGWQVETCSAGDVALASLESDAHYDLLLLDNDLPGMSGLEILRRVRSLVHRKRMPVIMLSGSDCVMEAHRAGANVFLRKPEDIYAVVETITHMLPGAGGGE